MKMVKSLILGSAAALVAMSGAQAADLPVKAKAVEYVRICSLYGAGFYYIPGTDTCIKLGGYLRVDTTFNGGIFDQPAWNGNLGQQNRVRDYYAARSRLAFSVDTRTATEYGVVRTFGQVNFNMNSSTGEGPTVAGSQSLGVDMVFIQFAGFTFGKSASAYASPWHAYPGNNSSFLLGGHDDVVGTNNIQYTAQFGNGVSATIGLDDPYFGRTVDGYINPTPSFALSAATGLIAASIGGAVGASGAVTNGYAGARAPDIVGNIRVDQAWGLFQLSGSLHENHATYYTPTNETSGHPNAKWGGSVMAALQIKNIPTGPGDDIKVDVSYAKGNTKNVLNTAPQFAMYSGTGLAGGYQSIGFGTNTDALYGNGGQLELTTAYGIRGAFNHNWDPYWSTSLFGSYAAIRQSTNGKALYCAGYAAQNTGAVSGDFSCNPDFDVSQLGVVTRWTPVKNLTFSAEAMWFHLDQKFTGSKTLTSTQLGATKPTALYEYKDQNAVSLNVRVQRNF